jgi:hypothetical protein
MKKILIGIVILICTSARADPASVRIEMCISGKGIAPEVLTTTRVHFVRHLKSLKVEFVSKPQEGNCCTTPECLGEEAVEQGAQGILNIQLLRFGPMVRATFYLFDAVTKKQIIMFKGTTSAKRFPKASAFIPEIGRCLNLLRKHAAPPPRPKKPKVVTSKPPERPRPVEVKPKVAYKPPPVHVTAPPPETDTGYYWLGVSLIAGGVSLAAVGVYFLLGPMAQAADRVEETKALWKAASEQAEIDMYYNKLVNHDEEADDYETIGWAGVLTGAALAVGGAIVLLLAPDGGPPERGNVSVRPYLLSEGGGLVFELPW